MSEKEHWILNYGRMPRTLCGRDIVDAILRNGDFVQGYVEQFRWTYARASGKGRERYPEYDIIAWRKVE